MGDNGVVLESVDAALHWNRTEIPRRPPLIDVAACPDSSFYLLDFRRGLWARASPSEAWTRSEIRTKRTVPATHPDETVAPRYLALTCDGSGRLWAVGEQSSILRSDDGGVRWHETSPTNRDRLLTAVAFIDPLRGRVVGEFGTYFETDDGGAAWRRGPDLPDDLYPQAAYFAPDGGAWAVGNRGRIYRFSPGADAWVAERSGTGAALYGIAPVGPRLLVVGGRGVGLIREVADQAGRWRELSLEHAARGAEVGYLRGIADLGAEAFVAVGQRVALRVDLGLDRPVADRAGQ